MVSSVKQPKHLPWYAVTNLVKDPKTSRRAIIFIMVISVKQPKQLPWYAVTNFVKRPKNSMRAIFFIMVISVKQPKPLPWSAVSGVRDFGSNCCGFRVDSMPR